ncbi:MAG TPA: YkgJ family cysteine cluster protein [Bryobacteraceae bacterium]|nr:YkgJ family cysteine cluster protein [Bryobacteraceae bacterium]
MRGDRELIQIVDTALAEAQRRSGDWLTCRLGCFQCCIGPFPITALDAIRLREGLAALQKTDPGRAGRVLARARDSVARLRREFPDDPVARVLEVDDAADDELCPALDPASGACDLYEARPITCRTFGPAVRFAAEAETQAAGVCELCYAGASEEQIAACAVEVDTRLESKLLRQLEKTGIHGETLVAFALAEAS